MSPGFFRALAYLYRQRAATLRCREPLTERQREQMARLFDSLADNADVVVECMQRLKSAALPPLSKAEKRRVRVVSDRKRKVVEHA